MSSHWFGLHERLSTEALRAELREAGVAEGVRWKKSLDREELGPALVAHLSQVFGALARSLRDSDRNAWAGALRELEQALASAGEPLASLPRQLPDLPFRQLLEVLRPESEVVGARPALRPDLPLGVSALLTGGGVTPSLVSQLEKELASADRVDWLVSFIKWSGLLPLRDALLRLTEVPAPDGGPRLRVATTSYMGATDLKAVRFLAGLDHTELKVSEDVRRTRLHVKAYMSRRGPRGSTPVSGRFLLDTEVVVALLRGDVTLRPDGSRAGGLCRGAFGLQCYPVPEHGGTHGQNCHSSRQVGARSEGGS